MGQQEISTIEDLVFNPSFRNWVLYNRVEDQQYWHQWLKNHPEKSNLLNYAKAIVYALSASHKQLSDEEVKEEIQSIIRKAQRKEVPNTESFISGKRKKDKLHIKRMYGWVAGAAAVLILAILSVFYFTTKNAGEKDTAARYELAPAKNVSSFVEQINNSDSVQTLVLSDSSRVLLYPKSKLSYSQNAFNEKRQVYLTGEAFFDVKKNPASPFFVYTKNMVTKVLGTSFTVKAYSSEKKASVLVRTGKVSVYKKENFSEKNAVANKLDGMIVTPNQQVVYDLLRNQLSKTIIDKPVILNNANAFAFDSTPLKKVFEVLQNTYGITIMYDESVISSCSLSAEMGNESFYEKLELICKAIDATYESIDGTIFISAKGCN